jgi:hypothetical protein
MVGNFSVIKSTAVKCPLNFVLQIIANLIPTLSCKHFLLMLIDRKTRASDSKLDDEKTEQNDHVEEETDLMMLCGSIETEE